MATQTTNIPGSGYGNVYIDSLIWGDGWVGSQPITYTFRSGSNSSNALGSFFGSTWVASETNAIRDVFNSYSAVCNLVFNEVANNSVTANIALWSLGSSDLGANTLGMFDTPNNTYAQLYGYFNWQANSLSTLQPGGLYYSTMIHEIGHGLGLAHPHDGGTESDASIFPGASVWNTGTYGLNQGVWTVMSYNAGYDQAPPTVAGGYGDVSTPMAFDIAALQRLYGANSSYRTGNDVYVLDAINAIGTDWSCIWDAGGSDTISNQNSLISCVINLNAAPLVGQNAGGYISQVKGVSGGFTVANGVVIENAIGGYGNDLLVGNAANNTLTGGAGNDTLDGGMGSDTINGGVGIDCVRYLYSKSNYVISKSSGVYNINGLEGSDSVTGLEYFQFLDQTLSLAQVDGQLDVRAVFRFYNSLTGTHFYTGSAQEADAVFRTLATFNYEGVAFDKNATSAGSTLDVFRFFNTSTGTHFYTGSVAEKNAVLANLPSFNYEGVAYQGHLTQDAGTTALYRFFNTQTGTHFYTASAAEMQNVKTTLAGIYNYEGVAYYVDVA